MQLLIPCSYLFVPGNRAERFDKACAAGADAVIVDLEDAVPPADKASARAAVKRWLSSAKPVLIRINGADSEWFRDDVALCRTPGIAGIVLAKAERVEDIHFLAEHVGVATPILPLIETAQGFWNALELAQVQQVQRLLFGTIDFQLDLGISGDEGELLYFRSKLVLVSRIAGIQTPVDGITVAIDDAEQLRADTLAAKRLGFGGKLCIHPKQVGLVNECFGPSAREEAWAKRVVEAAAAAHGGVVVVDGKMVDRPVLARAEAILRGRIT